jgi:hypothetical protein
MSRLVYRLDSGGQKRYQRRPLPPSKQRKSRLPETLRRPTDEPRPKRQKHPHHTPTPSKRGQ